MWRELQLLLLGYASPLPSEPQPPDDGVWEIRTLTLRTAAIELYQPADDDELVFRDFAIAWWRGKRDGCIVRTRRSLERGAVYEMAAELVIDPDEAFGLPLELYRSPGRAGFDHLFFERPSGRSYRADEPLLVGVRQGIELGKGCRAGDTTIGRIMWASRNYDLRVETTNGIKSVRRTYLEYEATVQLKETCRADLRRSGAFYSVTSLSESAETVGVHTRLIDYPPGYTRVALTPPYTVV